MQATSDTDRRTRDYERTFFGGLQVTPTHFYSIGSPDDADYEDFAYGYFTHDGIFRQGVTRYDGENFNASPLSQPPIR